VGEGREAGGKRRRVGRQAEFPARSSVAWLVSTVTAISSGRLAEWSMAARAACIIRRPPSACTFSIHTPSSPRQRQACATGVGNVVVLEIEKNLESVRAELTHKLRTGNGEQFPCHFQAALVRREPAGERQRSIGRRKIERDDDARPVMEAEGCMVRLQFALFASPRG